MFESVGWTEILVLALIGLFVLGPERLPGAVRWVADTVRTVREYAAGARDQLRDEIGPEFEELRKPLEDLRSIRDLDPRRAVRRSLFDPVADGTWSGAATPASPDPATGSGAMAGGAALTGANGSAAGSTGPHGLPAASGGSRSAAGHEDSARPVGREGAARGSSDPLAAGEQAPFDPDAT